VCDFKLGYPNLATFKNSSDSFAVYRRFGYLQSRLLLEKQDVLRVLERRLDQYDREHVTTSFTRDLGADDLIPRQALLEEIEHAFNSYGKNDPALSQRDPKHEYSHKLKPSFSNLLNSYWRSVVRQIQSSTAYKHTSSTTIRCMIPSKNTSDTSTTSSLFVLVEIMRGLTEASIVRYRSYTGHFLF
jgi:hypothetical protein